MANELHYIDQEYFDCVFLIFLISPMMFLTFTTIYTPNYTLYTLRLDQVYLIDIVPSVVYNLIGIKQ